MSEQESIPRWAKGIRDRCNRIREEIELSEDDFKEKLNKKEVKMINGWAEKLNEIINIVKEIVTAKEKVIIPFDDALKSIISKPYDGSYILALGDNDIVLKSWRLEGIDPAKIHGIEFKEEPRTVEMTKRFIEITVSEPSVEGLMTTLTRPAPKDVKTIKLIDGRSGEVVR